MSEPPPLFVYAFRIYLYVRVSYEASYFSSCHLSHIFFLLTFLVCSHLPDFYFSFPPVFPTDLETKYKYKKVTISSPSGKTDPQKPFSSLVRIRSLAGCLSLARSLRLSLARSLSRCLSLSLSDSDTHYANIALLIPQLYCKIFVENTGKLK